MYSLQIFRIFQNRHPMYTLLQ